MRAFVPWAVAAILVGVLLHRIPPADIALALGQADIPLFLGISALGVGIWFVLESATYAYLFTRMGVRLSWAEARSVRGMTYLLAPIHWNVGKAAVVLRLNRLRGMPILEGTSAILLYQLMSMAALALLASVGFASLRVVGDNPQLTRDLGFVSPLLPFTLFVGCLALCLMLRTRRPDIALVRRLRALPINRAFRRAHLVELLALVLIKSVYHLVFACAFFGGLHAFGVELPFLLVLIGTPIIQFAGGLPITPAGLGTQQAAMVYFFSGRFGGSEAAVAAFSFTFPIVVMLFRAGIGLFYVGDLSRTAPDSKTDSVQAIEAGKTPADRSETRSRP